MKAVFLFFGVVMASPQMLNHDYIPPGDGDVRSPCPFLNTMANHGYLPRTGYGVTFEGIKQAIVNVMGVNENFASLADGTKNSSPFFGRESFDLDFQNQRDREGDLSLTRYDQTEQPLYHDQTPQKFLVKGLIDLAYEDPSESGNKKIGYEQVKQFRGIRYNQETGRERSVPPRTDQIPAVGFNCVLLLEVLGRNGTISVDDMRSFLEKEKIPDGWVKGDGSDALTNRIFGALSSDPCHWEIPE